MTRIAAHPNATLGLFAIRLPTLSFALPSRNLWRDKKCTFTQAIVPQVGSASLLFWPDSAFRGLLPTGSLQEPGPVPSGRGQIIA